MENTDTQNDETALPKKTKIMVVDSSVGMVGRSILHEALAEKALRENLDIVIVDMEDVDRQKLGNDDMVADLLGFNNTYVKDSLRALNDIKTLEMMPHSIDRSYPKPSQIINTSKPIGRNQPCSCGSGVKYKKCCGK